MSMMRHPQTGCKPQSLFGPWSIEPTRFQKMLDIALAADLNKLAQDQKEMAQKGVPGPPPYEMLADGIAGIRLDGPMTKYDSSFSSLFGGVSTVRTRRAVRDAMADPNVKGIMLIFDSPGGTVAGTSDLADDVLR